MSENSTTTRVYGLIGFAIRAGKIVYGLDRIESRGKKHVIFLCESAGNNTSKAVRRIASENGIPLFISKSPLDDLVHKTNCKVIALTDKSMANGVLNILRNSNGEDYIEVK